MEQVSSATQVPSRARVHVQHPMLAMVSMWVGAFIGMFSETSLNIALPSLMKSLGVTTATIQWLVTGYMLVIGIVLPFSSFLTKWFTTRQLIVFGLADFIVGAIIAATAGTFPVLLAGRMIQGIGTGLILPLMFTVAMSIFPPNKLGAAMGTNALVIMFAPAIGPTLTGIILAKLSWHWLFWLFVPILAIGLVFALTSLKNVGKITKPRPDYLSMIGSVIGFSAIVFGVSMASARGWNAPIVLIALVLGVLVITLYARRQLRLKTPILNLKVFKIPAFTTGALLVMIDFGIILSAMYLLPMYIQNGLGLVVALTGIIMLPGGVVNALVSALAGRLYDHLGAKAPTRIGFIIAFIGASMLTMTTTNSSVVYVIAAHVIMMIGAPLAMSPAQTYALNSLSGMMSADGSTIMNTMQQIVGAIATAVATSLLGIGETAFTGANKAAAFTNGVHYGAYFTVALTVVGFIIALFIKAPVTAHADRVS